MRVSNGALASFADTRCRCCTRSAGWSATTCSPPRAESNGPASTARASTTGRSSTGSTGRYCSCWPAGAASACGSPRSSSGRASHRQDADRPGQRLMEEREHVRYNCFSIGHAPGGTGAGVIGGGPPMPEGRSLEDKSNGAVAPPCSPRPWSGPTASPSGWSASRPSTTSAGSARPTWTKIHEVAIKARDQVTRNRPAPAHRLRRTSYGATTTSTTSSPASPACIIERQRQDRLLRLLRGRGRGAELPHDDKDVTRSRAADYAFTSRLTDRPVKFSLTGPFSLSRRISGASAYRDPADLVRALARRLNLEAQVAGGRRWASGSCRIDEPFLAGCTCGAGRARGGGGEHRHRRRAG